MLENQSEIEWTICSAHFFPTKLSICEILNSNFNIDPHKYSTYLVSIIEKLKRTELTDKNAAKAINDRLADEIETAEMEKIWYKN